jgi:hypothetical protein
MPKTVRLTIILLFSIFLAVVLLSGCGEKKATDNGAQGNGKSTQSDQQYSLNQAVECGGATFSFTDVEEVESIPVAFEEEVYTPEKGKYVVVYFTFQGDEGNEVGGIDLAIFKLADRQGNVYYMDTDLANYEANDLALEEDLAIPSTLMWSNPEEKNSLLVFDVNPNTDGFSLQLRQQDASGETVPVATVDLGI